MKTIAKNPLKYNPQELDDLYKPMSIISTTQEEISEHLNLSPRAAGMAHAAAIDIDKLDSPLSQNVIDIFQQSGTSWDEFKKTSNTLSNLGKHTSTILNSYQTNFKRSIYAPLLSYLLPPQQPDLLKGDPNLLLQQLSDVYSHLKQRRMPRNCCLQICVRSQNPFQNSDVDEDWKPHFAAKETTYTDFTSIGQRMEERIGRFDDNSGCYCYERYEILSDNKEQFQIFEAKCNDTIPPCSFQHPLCKIYNATQNILPNGELDAKAPGLITVSFIKCNDCIRIDLIFSDGAQLYGKRIFKQDMMNTVPKLFADPQLTPITHSQLNKLTFLADPIYNEYHKHVTASRNSLADRLPGFVDAIADHHNKYKLNLLALTRCFDDYNIDDEYIRNHTVKEFRELLRTSCRMAAGTATSLWRYLGGFPESDQNISAPQFGRYMYYDEKEASEDDEEKDDDEAEYDPFEETEFFEALLFMHNDYEEEEIQQLSQEFRAMLLAKQPEKIQDNDYNGDGLSPPPWAEDEDEDADNEEEEEEASPSCKDDNNDGPDDFEDDDEDPPAEQAQCYDNESEMDYVDENLSFQSDWSEDEEDEDEQYVSQEHVYDSDLEIQSAYGESLSPPSEWEDEVDNTDFNRPDPPSYIYLDYRTVEDVNVNAMVNFLLSYNKLFNYSIIRYLLFYDHFVNKIANFDQSSKRKSL